MINLKNESYLYNRNNKYKLTKMNKKYWLFGLLIVAAIVSRLIPHMHNFSPILAISLFGAAYFQNKKVALVVPLAATFLSDVLLRQFVYPDYALFYEGWYFQYIAYLLIVISGLGIFKKVNLGRIALGTLSGTILFFLVSNFGSWLALAMYPKTLSGLVSAYTAGIPFIQGTFLSTVLYSVVLFGAYRLYARKFSVATSDIQGATISS